MIDITDKRFVIIGLPGSGKTTLARHILNSSERVIVYDPMSEYQGYRRYVPNDPHSIEELDDFIVRVVARYKPDIFMLDEANRYIQPKPNRLPRAVADMVDVSRHWGVAWGAIARRPSQLHTDILELAHFGFVFNLSGKNDRRALDNWYAGLGDAVASLPPYHFAVVESGKGFEVHTPVESGR